MDSLVFSVADLNSHNSGSGALQMQRICKRDLCVQTEGGKGVKN